MSEKVSVILTQEEMDCINYDARDGDLSTLKEIFEEIPAETLIQVRDENTLSTPVHMAAGNGHKEVVEFLLSILPNEDAKKLANQQNESGNTPLHWACYNGNLEVVQLLCEKYDADAMLRNSAGHDAIYEAETNDRQEISTWILKRFAVEDDLKVDEDGENTKITYRPGTESRETEEEAKKQAEKNEAVNAVKDGVENLDV